MLRDLLPQDSVEVWRKVSGPGQDLHRQASGMRMPDAVATGEILGLGQLIRIVNIY